jgi:AcrR family transcriptional regulator
MIASMASRSSKAGAGAAPPSLQDRQSALTRRLLLDAMVEHLEAGSPGDLTMRSIARRAGVAERTIFRHFASRDELLDALAVEVTLRLELPPAPDSIEALAKAPQALYRAYEARARLTQAALHSELFDRIRQTVARERWDAIRRLLDGHAPRRSERERTYAATNLRHMLSASTWNYYRSYFQFSLKDSIGAAEQAIRDALRGLAG